MALRIIITGGTFDKQYDAIRGQLTFKDSHLPEIIEQVRSTLGVELEINQLVDSLDMQDDNRQRVLAACRRAPENYIVMFNAPGQDKACEIVAAAQPMLEVTYTGPMQ